MYCRFFVAVVQCRSFSIPFKEKKNHMIVVSLLCGLARSWKCDHDILQKSIKVNRPPQVKSSAKLMVGERQPIRIKFDTTYIDSSNPEGLKTCQSADDQITWGGYTYRCTEGDLWTADKQKVIKDTFANIQAFLESTLKVNRVTGTLDIGKVVGYPFPSKTAQDTDLYITLYPRPFGETSNTLASAAYTQQDSTGRHCRFAVCLCNLILIFEEFRSHH